LDRFSILVRNRKVFIACALTIALLKIFLSAIAPASFDLRDIVKLAGSAHSPIGPWIALYPPLYGQTGSNLSQLQPWLVQPPSVQLMSLLFRLPVFAFDVATAIVLYYVAKKTASQIEGRLAFYLWFANPFSLFSIELLGVPDVAATFFVVLAFWLFLSNRPLYGALALALGTWIKFFPILLLPPLMLFGYLNGVSGRRIAAALSIGLIGLAGYLSWLFPIGGSFFSSIFYLTNYTPVTQPFPFIYGPSAVNGSAFILIFFYCLLGLFWKKPKNLIGILLPTFLVYYAVSNPYPQYLIWAMPLMALDIALLKRRRVILFAIFYTLAFAQWFFTSSAFLTPSGYSLLMIPLAERNPSWYVHAITSFLESYPVALLLPLVSSSFFACVLIYAVDVARSWFTATPHEREQP
jgi:uncharacterized membrane protein